MVIFHSYVIKRLPGGIPYMAYDVFPVESLITYNYSNVDTQVKYV